MYFQSVPTAHIISDVKLFTCPKKLAIRLHDLSLKREGESGRGLFSLRVRFVCVKRFATTILVFNEIKADVQAMLCSFSEIAHRRRKHARRASLARTKLLEKEPTAASPRRFRTFC